MKGMSCELMIGISVGLIVGVVLAISTIFCIRFQKRCSQIWNSNSSSLRGAASVHIHFNGVDTSIALSDSTVGQDTPRTSEWNNMSLCLDGLRRKNVVLSSTLPHYSYKDLQKATFNFTTVIGQGSFGVVYKAQMSTVETVAVKVLATNSRQGEKEFLTEVLLSGRLHHRNLVNLVGYCAEKEQHMLVYVYMTNGSLASHLYSEKLEQLISWDLRVNIALDVARGLEYLHYGAIPPVIHRDIKSSNILLDRSMRARVFEKKNVFDPERVKLLSLLEQVADFGLSREEMINPHASNVRGTFGYLDPEYMSTRTFTKKSDVYSFGVLFFELIAGRSPLQGLMEYVELAVINTEGKVGWQEIMDSRLDGRFVVRELNDMAALAYKCVNRISEKRPSMRDIVQALSQILKLRHVGKHEKETWSATTEEICIELDRLETQDFTAIKFRTSDTAEPPGE